MESLEITRNNQNHQARPNTRRISSILKAPRTPVKVFGSADNEDCQEEPTQPIEKKRKSRRVSFAATNDVKYIRDLKNGSPALDLLEDLNATGAEPQDELACTIENGNQHITGMETLLNAPLHVTHQNDKENVFFGPSSQGIIADKTVVFSGEDVEYMDMTHSHTVIIDNDPEEVKVTYDQDTAKNACYGNRRRGDSAYFKNPTASGKAQIEESDLEDFLASLSETSREKAPEVAPRSPKAGTLSTQLNDHSPTGAKFDTKAFFSRLNALKSGVDKENQAPAPKQLVEYEGRSLDTPASSFPSVRHGLQDLTQAVSPEDLNNMDMTKSHTVLIDARKPFQHTTAVQSGKQEDVQVTTNKTVGTGRNSLATLGQRFSAFDPNNVEMRKSQTFVDTREICDLVKPSFSAKRKSICSSASNQTIRFSEEDCGMEMTAALAMPIENNVLTNADTAIHTANHRPDPSVFLDPDDMEMTKSQTVVIDSKNCGLDKPSFETGRKGLSYMYPSDKTVQFSENDCGMDMTTALTVPIEENRLVQASGSKAMGSMFSTTEPDPPSNQPDRLPITHHFAHTNSSTYISSDPDDMEMTRSQTVVIDSKDCGMVNPSQGAVRKGLPYVRPSNQTVLYSEDDYGMEMTTALTVPIVESNHSSNLHKSKARHSATTKHVSRFDQPDMVKRYSQPTNFNDNVMSVESSDPNDMEMTRSQTVVIDSKDCGMVNPSQGALRKGLPYVRPSNQTVLYSEDDYGMEMTTALTVPIVESNHSSNLHVSKARHSATTKHVSRFDQPDMVKRYSQQTNFNDNVMSAESSDPDDMEMTRSQTVVIDSKDHGMVNPSQGAVRKGLPYVRPSNQTVLYSEDDYGMEMTTALTAPIEKCDVPASADKAMVKFLPTTRPVSLSDQPKGLGMRNGQSTPFDHSSVWPHVSSESDDMEMTRSQTVVIDSKDRGMVNPSLGTGRRSLSYMPASNKTVIFTESDYGMEMTTALTAPIEENDFILTSGDNVMGRTFPLRKSVPRSDQLDDTGMARGQEACACPNVMTSVASDPDDMEMTRSQTVVIDKDCEQINPPVRAGRKSVYSTAASHHTARFSEDDCGMEMTAALTVPIEDNCYSSRNVNKSTVRHGATTNLHSDKPDDLGMARSPFMSSNPDDMEITRSQTVAIDSKICEQINLPVRAGSKSVCSTSASNCTTRFSEDDRGIEMTAALTVPSEDSQTASGDNATEKLFPTPLLSQSDLLDDMRTTRSEAVKINHNVITLETNGMEMTGSQTVVADPRNCGQVNPWFRPGRKSLSYKLPSNKNVLLFEDDRGMEMTTAPTVPLEDGNVLTTVEEARARHVPRTKPVSLANQPGGNAISIPQAALTDGKKERVHPLLNNERRSVSNFSQQPLSNKTVVLPEDDCVMEMATAITGPLEESNHVPKNGDGAVVGLSTVATSVSHSDVLQGLKSDQTGSDMFRTADPETGIAASSSTVCLNTVQSTLAVGERKTTGIEGNFVSYDQRDLEGKALQPSELMANNDTVIGPFVMGCTEITSDGSALPVNTVDSLFMDPPSLIQKENKCVKTTKKQRRVSLVDLQSKLHSIRNTITEPADVAEGSDPAALPHFVYDSVAKDTGSTNYSPVRDCVNHLSSNHSITPMTSKDPEAHPWEENVVHRERANMTAPVNFLKSKPHVARKSFGGFLPKLPQKNKPIEQKREEFTGVTHFGKRIHQSTAGIVSQKESADAVENIDEEVLPEMSSEEDLSETVEGRVPTPNSAQEDPSHGSLGQVAEDDEVFVKPVQNVSQGQKRPSPVGGHDDTLAVERKMRKSPDSKEPSACTVQWDGNVAGIAEENLPSMMAKTMDSTSSSNNSTYLKAEGTFETSVMRCSQYEIHFDEASGNKFDLRKKLEDGSITVRDFLKIFGIDFVIHKPRQSVLPNNFASAHKAQDRLVEKHLQRPRQRVYEEDCEDLSDMIERLKSRIWDQDKPLMAINQSFWEVVKTYSEEQLQSLGTKLKERKAYFRKKSKAQSHEMKIGLYTSLVQTTQLAQQNLSERLKETDELLKNLDGCIQDLETELVSMENECMERNDVNSELELTLNAKQKELESLNAAVSEKERKIVEMQLEKNSAQGKVGKLRDETKELENYITVLDRVIEWKLSEETENRAVFSFLYGSVQLEVLFETAASAPALTEPDRNVADIKFHMELDGEKSQCYARLVHSLIGRFVRGEGSWLRKYPRKQDVPRLLHDVSVVVSRCRVLGEEIHQLRRWGSLKLDILEITCQDTQVKILFSSLKAFAKFEVTLGVTSAYPNSHLQVLSFKNYIGNIRVDLLKEIVSSVVPAKNYLTRIVKKIQNVALC